MNFLPGSRKDADGTPASYRATMANRAFRPERRRNRGRMGRSRRLILPFQGTDCQSTVSAIHVLHAMETVMLALRLPAQIEKRLNSLAKKTGRSKSFYAREAILRHLEDLEDYHLARRRLARKAARVTLEDLERELAETR
jgi:RHH-type transcriptional regulator, rel operon repressor / antitoxin RelB